MIQLLRRSRCRLVKLHCRRDDHLCYHVIWIDVRYTKKLQGREDRIDYTGVYEFVGKPQASEGCDQMSTEPSKDGNIMVRKRPHEQNLEHGEMRSERVLW